MEIVSASHQEAPGNTQETSLIYNGDGLSLFGITLVNALLCLITLNFYYPWARERKLKYIYSETSFFGSRFAFHGTGREMFLGYVKALLILLIFYALVFYLYLDVQEDMTIEELKVYILSLYGLVLLFTGLVIPLAIHGALKYRLAKTSWRGMRMGYRGSRQQLYAIFIRDLALTILTLGLYRSWFIVNLRKYLIGNIRLGNITFRYVGAGDDLFLLNLKGMLLTMVTFGIYSFWWMRDLYTFHTENIRVLQNDNELTVRSAATVEGIFGLLIGNWLIITFTFGLAAPWAITRQLKFYMQNAILEGGFDPDAVTQTEQEYNDALAEDLADFLDLGIV